MRRIELTILLLCLATNALIAQQQEHEALPSAEPDTVIRQEAPAPQDSLAPRDSLAQQDTTIQPDMALSSDTITQPDTFTQPDTTTHPDTITQPDTTASGQSIDEYTPLWESDTLYLGEDSVQQYNQAPLVKGDTTIVQSEMEHSASQALMYALVLPGLGQVYNKKYWKIPIVWAAIGGGIYAISYNTSQYKQSSEYYVENPDDPNAERYLQFWRRNMELSFIATAAIYALQALDAYVDALLYYWDVNENLSMEVGPSLSPVINPAGFVDPALGFTCRLNLKYGGLK